MAATIYTNITSGTTTTLITKGGRVSGSINSIMISNVDGHQADNVCLFLEDAAASASTSASNNKYYLFNSTLYNLRIITQNASDGGTPNLTVIIK